MKNKLLEKTFQVLNAILYSPEPITLKELSLRLELNISTLSRITSDLLEAGYISKADYHSFEAGVGVARLEQNAMSNFRLTRKVNPILSRRSRALGVELALAGMDCMEVIYLYRTDYSRLPSVNGMPYYCNIFYSNIGIAILAQMYSSDEALDLICKNAKVEVSEKDKQILHEQIVVSAQDRYYLKFEKKDNWNISFPFQYNNQWYGVALYGKGANRRNMEHLLDQAKRLDNNIQESLGIF